MEKRRMRLGSDLWGEELEENVGKSAGRIDSRASADLLTIQE